MPSSRRFRWYDLWLVSAQHYLEVLPRTTVCCASPSPAADLQEVPLSKQASKRSAGLMRVNHTGEVCAQALYLGQHLTTPDLHLKQVFMTAAKEETDHLHWCAQRLNELNSHQSYLNPFWFTGSFLIGAAAGLAGDKWSLGFLAQTEQQVSAHLQSHLERLAPEDVKSRAIVKQMQQDEIRHATHAIELGGIELPTPIKITMKIMSKVMTTFTYYV